MCPNCFPAGIYSFPSWWEYEAFEQQLLRKQLKLMPATVAPLAELVVRFACPICWEVWVLSEPENAWRGYFLPAAAAQVYTRRLAARDKARRFGCGLLLLGVVLYVGWQLL